MGGLEVDNKHIPSRFNSVSWVLLEPLGIATL